MTAEATSDIILLPHTVWDLVPYEQKEINRGRKSSKSHDWNECICCGRALNPSAKLFWVHWSFSGNLYPVNISDEVAYAHPEGDQGWFPVGADCAKKIPAEYKSKAGE